MNLVSKLKVTAAVAAAVAAGAFAAGPHAVHADALSDVDAAVFTGTTVSPTTPIQWTPNSGIYTFNAPSCLASASTDGPEILGGCSVHSTGSYTNVVCGTGLATGSAAILEGDGETDNINYNIVFVGGVGVIVPQAPVAQSGPGDGAAIGVVDILPSSLTLPPGVGATCTPGFNVTVAAAVVG